MALGINKNLKKAEGFLIEGHYEEAVERSFKSLEKILQYLFNKFFTDLEVETQLNILLDIKDNYEGKPFNDLRIGEKLRIFDTYKLLSNYTSLSKEINPNKLLKLNSIRVDSTHQRRDIPKGDAFYAYSVILCFLDKIKNLIGPSEDVILEETPELIAMPEAQEQTIFDNLPSRDYVEFIGREEKIQEIKKFLLHKKVHVLSIDGIGGVGKSALALELSHRLRDDKIYDAIIWVSAKKDKLTYSGIVDIESKLDNLEDLFDEILKVFEENDFVEHGSLETKGNMVLQILKENNCLLIVDNLETIDDENLKNFLIDINFPVESKVLITSRKRLGQVEYVVYLDKFTLDETRKYISSQLKHRNFNEKCSEVLLNSIYEKTGGIPLAIKVIIPWIVEGRVRADIVEDIDKETDILKFCFEKVYNDFLSDPAQKLFCVLSLAPTEISDTALKFISGLTEDDFNESLNSLINYALIFKDNKSPGTEQLYSMLPLTQEFGKNMADNYFGKLKEEIKKSYLRYIELSQSEVHSEKRAIAINKAEEAGRLFSTGEIERAEDLFKEAINYDKECDYALFRFAVFSKERQDFGRAVNLVERAIRLNPTNPHYWNEYGSIVESSGNFNKTEKILEEALIKTNYNRSVVQKLCLIKTKLQKNKDVINIVKKSILDKYPDKKDKFINTLLATSLLESYWRLASGLYKSNKRDESFKLLSESVDYFQDLREKRLIFNTNDRLLWAEKKTYHRLGDIAKEKNEAPLAKIIYNKALYNVALYSDRQEHNKLIERKIDTLEV